MSYPITQPLKFIAATERVKARLEARIAKITKEGPAKADLQNQLDKIVAVHQDAVAAAEGYFTEMLEKSKIRAAAFEALDKLPRREADEDEGEEDK